MKRQYLEGLFEDVKEKFELVIEGQQGLQHEIKEMRQEMNERFELVDLKIDVLNKKIDNVHDKLDAKIDTVENRLTERINKVETNLSDHIGFVAADLAAHRADTENHRKDYKVSDGS